MGRCAGGRGRGSQCVRLPLPPSIPPLPRTRLSLIPRPLLDVPPPPYLSLSPRWSSSLPHSSLAPSSCAPSVPPQSLLLAPTFAFPPLSSNRKTARRTKYRYRTSPKMTPLPRPLPFRSARTRSSAMSRATARIKVPRPVSHHRSGTTLLRAKKGRGRVREGARRKRREGRGGEGGGRVAGVLDVRVGVCAVQPGQPPPVHHLEPSRAKARAHPGLPKP